MSSRGEVFRFAYVSWDVETAKEFVPEEVDNTISVDACVGYVNGVLGVSVDTEYAEGLPDERLEDPIICGHLPDSDPHDPEDGLFPIDGWHRIWAAHQRGVKSLPCYVLARDQEEVVRTDHRGPDERTQFVEWALEQAHADPDLGHMEREAAETLLTWVSDEPGRAFGPVLTECEEWKEAAAWLERQAVAFQESLWSGALDES